MKRFISAAFGSIHIQRLMLTMMVLLVFALPAFAQTATIVPITVDVNAILGQTNTWIDIFIPFVSIGIGIAIALAILGFVGDKILEAFRR